MNSAPWYRRCTAYLLLCVLAAAVTNGRVVGQHDEQPYLSPIDIVGVPGQQYAVVACHTANRLLRVRLSDGEIDRQADLPGRPTGVIVTADGNRIYVTVGVADGVVVELDGQSLAVLRTIPIGHTPMSPRLGVDGRFLYVCVRFQDEVAVVDLTSGKINDRIPVAREPVAADITPDGRYLFVANHLPDGRADGEFIACKVSVVDTGARALHKTVTLVNGAEGMRGIRVTPDGNYVLATHLVARFHVPTSQVTRGWINTNALSVIRVADLELLNTVLLDDVDRGFANPWGIDMSGDGQRLAVSGAGTHEVSLIDLESLLEKSESAWASRPEQADAALEAHNDLSFLHGIRKRLDLAGKGPRALCFVDDDLYVAEYFSDSVSRVSGAAKLSRRFTRRSVVSLPLGPTIDMTPTRLGEYFFNDASLCLQTWQSCASCHPDARTDGLNWDLLNDGIGNPKNAKSLLLSHVTPPVMSLGVRADAETAVRAGIRHIQFAVRPEEDAAAIDEYLKSLEPIPSPYLVDGELSESAVRGKALFASMNCNKCHPAPLFTDLKSYRSNIANGLDAGKSFDTPTLIEMWRTAPYLHDGRAATAEEVLRYHPKPGPDGTAAQLTDEQRRDLATYILSL